MDTDQYPTVIIDSVKHEIDFLHDIVATIANQRDGATLSHTRARPFVEVIASLSGRLAEARFNVATFEGEMQNRIDELEQAASYLETKLIEAHGGKRNESFFAVPVLECMTAHSARRTV